MREKIEKEATDEFKARKLFSIDYNSERASQANRSLASLHWEDASWVYFQKSSSDVDTQNFCEKSQTGIVQQHVPLEQGCWVENDTEAAQTKAT